MKRRNNKSEPYNFKIIGIILITAAITMIATTQILLNSFNKDLNDAKTPHKEMVNMLKESNKIVDDKLTDLITTGVWGHTSSNGCDFECRSDKLVNMLWVKKVGENLYHGRCDIAHAYDKWEKSPAHKVVLDMESDFEILRYRKASDGQCYIILYKVQLTK